MIKLIALGLIFASTASVVSAKVKISTSRLSKLSGEKQVDFTVKHQWDQKYNKRTYVYGKAPAGFLAQNYSVLKPGSRVLDMGMGEGRNAVFLAKKGHHVLGVDISSVAIRKAKSLAKENRVKIKTILASLKEHKFPENYFDAIICFYYVDRELTEKIKKWLKPGGVLVYEAHTLHEYYKNKQNQDPKNYYLKPQELLGMFDGMSIIKYEEPLHEKEFRSSIILKKI